MKEYKRKPDFSNLTAVLEKKIPKRPTLFEFFLNGNLEKYLCEDDYDISSRLASVKTKMKAFKNAGYDYVTLGIGGFYFERLSSESKNTKSINGHGIITDNESFNRYKWLNPNDFNYSELDSFAEILPKGMKIIVCGPDGVLENVIGIVGYDNLCIMLYENPQLVSDIFEHVGERLLNYYNHCIKYDCVGALISNDDWGFNTQTMLSPADMRKYCFPWHKKISQAAHEQGKYAILHSCGRYDEVIDDVIDDMKFDARHSYEDNITPVEIAYPKLHDKIAVLGGIDVDFMTRKSPEEVYNRAKRLIEMTNDGGGYALGTGNSIADYIPIENYFAMTRAALEND